MLVVALLYLTSVSASSLSNPEKETCLRCICHASTACLDLQICAKEYVTMEYWSYSGNMTGTYSTCVEDDLCILNTIDAYTERLLREINDINCDGEVDCRDYFAAHLFGRDAKNKESVFTSARMKRFDRCTGSSVKNLTDNGWTPAVCFSPRAGLSRSSKKPTR